MFVQVLRNCSQLLNLRRQIPVGFDLRESSMLLKEVLQFFLPSSDVDVLTFCKGCRHRNTEKSCVWIQRYLRH